MSPGDPSSPRGNRSVSLAPPVPRWICYRWLVASEYRQLGRGVTWVPRSYEKSPPLGTTIRGRPRLPRPGQTGPSARALEQSNRSPLSTLHPTPYTLHPTPCTLHPTPYTLHPTPYTLHPTPCTLHPQLLCDLFLRLGKQASSSSSSLISPSPPATLNQQATIHTPHRTRLTPPRWQG